MILGRASRRYLLRHPLILFLSVLGVALGVAVVVAIDLANGSAERAFRLSARALSGRATHQVIGGPGGVAEAIYRRLRLEAGVRQSAPVVEGYAAVPSRPGTVLQILGVDPLAEAPFRTYSPAPGGENLSRLLTEPETVLLLPAAAERFGVEIGESLEVEVGGHRRTLLLIGLLEPPDEVAASALESLAVVDIATAQEILGRPGRLSRIDLKIPEEGRGALLGRVRAVLPPGVELRAAGGRGDVLAGMTRAFRLNLTALSLLALMVGMFLIYNTLSFSVLQRRELLGALRTLGVTRRELFLLVLGEAAVVGGAGTALGLLLGLALGSGLLHLVTRTINDLYFVLAVRELSVSPVSLAKGIALGLGTSVLAALVPAREAALSPPRTVLVRSSAEARQRHLAPLAAAAGGGLILAGLAVLAFSGRSIPLAFLSLFALIAGYALTVPWGTALLLHAFQPVAGGLFGLLGRMAARDLVASLSRTGVATAALVVAVSATVGMGIMIGSFRLTLVSWLESYLRADLYVTAAGDETAGRVPLDPEVLRRLSSLPNVDFVTRARHLSLPSASGEETDVFVVDMPPEGFAGYDFREGDPEAIHRALVTSRSVIASEPYAYRHGLKRGDRISLRTDRGAQTFTVAGIFTDYSTDRGRIVLSRDLYERLWDDPAVDALGIYLRPGVDPERIVEAARRSVGDRQRVTVYSNAGLRRASLVTFDRTFAITAVLRLLAVLIAFVGILSALLSMQIERARELAVLRANGLTPGQLWGLVIGETGLVGLLAGALALPLGLLQSLVLIHVINRRSFGWTLQTHLDPGIFFQAVLLALGAALLAGLYPAWRMARTPPVLALREE